TASLFCPGSVAFRMSPTAIAVLLKHRCALHYTLTRLPCKRAGMDKSILAHQLVHFGFAKEPEGRNFIAGIAAECPGLAGLVQFSDAIGRSVGRVKHGDRVPGPDGSIDLRRAADELARLARHVHHASHMLRHQTVEK